MTAENLVREAALHNSALYLTRDEVQSIVRRLTYLENELRLQDEALLDLPQDVLTILARQSGS